MKSEKWKWALVLSAALGALCLAVVFAMLWRGEAEKFSALQTSLGGEADRSRVKQANAPNLGGMHEVPARSAPSVPGSGMELADEDLLKKKQESEFSEFERRFRGDAPANGWSAAAKGALLDAVADPALAELSMPEKFETQCTAHMCNAIMEFPSRVAADDWAMFYPVGLGGVLGSVRMMPVSGPGNRVRLVFYGAREGYPEFLQTNLDPNERARMDSPGH